MQVRAVFVFLSVVVGNRADFVARFKRLPRGESLFGVYRIIYGFKPVAVVYRYGSTLKIGRGYALYRTGVSAYDFRACLRAHVDTCMTGIHAEGLIVYDGRMRERLVVSGVRHGNGEYYFRVGGFVGFIRLIGLIRIVGFVGVVRDVGFIGFFGGSRRFRRLCRRWRRFARRDDDRRDGDYGYKRDADEKVVKVVFYETEYSRILFVRHFISS